MESPIGVPVWASVVFRVVGSVNLSLSMNGLDYMLSEWLGGRDSNPDTQIQSLQSYR